MVKGPDSKSYAKVSYTDTAATRPIPKRFKMPDIPKYDGNLDPQEHLFFFTTAINGNDLTKNEAESVMVKKFEETLSGGALVWYSLLPENSIDPFSMLADSFIMAHAGAKKVQPRRGDIFNIDQGDTELFREFVARFQKEMMQLLMVPDDWIAEAFTKGLNPENSIASFKPKESLTEFEATTWADVHNHTSQRSRSRTITEGLLERPREHGTTQGPRRIRGDLQRSQLGAWDTHVHLG